MWLRTSSTLLLPEIKLYMACHVRSLFFNFYHNSEKSTLNVRALFGKTFSANHNVDLWKNFFHSRRQILGTCLRFDGKFFCVKGAIANHQKGRDFTAQNEFENCQPPKPAKFRIFVIPICGKNSKLRPYQPDPSLPRVENIFFYFRDFSKRKFLKLDRS